MDVPEIDPNFEPQARARSNTWPLRPKEIKVEDENSRSPTTDEHCSENNNKDHLGGGKKTVSRRNAWGNLSYADLITKAIQGTPEKRLTLSQIYDWMVQNVPYFKDKGDSNSSAGWKNSIRHNLSLHNRFMRIQNEGTGKSSWWVLNPDAKPGKAPRRRATSMDTKAYEKKRGRAKRKAEQLRAMTGGLSPTQSGSHDFVENGLIPEDGTLPFSLSPGDFRDRTSSNASSIGRLSPIQSALELDIDNQVPSMSPQPWQGGLDSSYTSQEGFNTETLTESLREMFVGENGDSYSEALGLSSNLSTPSPVPQQLSPSSNNSVNYPGGNAVLPTPPPPYPDHLRRSPQQTRHVCTTNINSVPSSSLSYSGGTMTQNLNGQDVGGNFMSQSMDVLQNDMYEGILDQDPMFGAPPGNNPPPRPPVSQFTGNLPVSQVMPQQVPQPSLPTNAPRLTSQQRQAQLLQMLRSQPSESLLRQALTQRTQLALQRQQAIKNAQMTPPQQRTVQQQQLLNAFEQQQQQLHAQMQQQQLQQQLSGNINGLSACDKKEDTMLLSDAAGGFIKTENIERLIKKEPCDLPQGCIKTEGMDLQPSTTGIEPSFVPLLPTDLDVNFSEMEAGDINCDVEQVLNFERSFDDTLDFNFDPNQQANQSSGDNPYVLQLSH